MQNVGVIMRRKFCWIKNVNKCIFFKYSLFFDTSLLIEFVPEQFNHKTNLIETENTN